MSKALATKPSAVKTITVSIEQFNTAVTSIKVSGDLIKADLVIACKYIAQCTVYTDQAKAKEQLAKAYQHMMTIANNKDYLYASASKWVLNNVKKLSGDTKFKMLESKSAMATKKRIARQTAGAKDKAVAPVAPVVPKIETSIEQMRKALIAKEREIADHFRGVIPAGKIKDFDSAFAAFIQTIEIILA